MKIAIIGGGINGLCTAWVLLQQGHEVALYERGSLMQQTSSRSSKLLHGGLRYLENGEFRLVKEALAERDFWLQTAPHLTHPIKIILPVFSTSRRPRWIIRTGLFLYDLLAGSHNIHRHQKECLDKFVKLHPEFDAANLLAVYSYYDGQMDDYKLGLWVAEQVRALGGVIYENSPVNRVTCKGEVSLQTNPSLHFDRIINVAGPWASLLLEQSNITADTRLDLIRGSHIMIDRVSPDAFILESPGERRIFFVLPYNGQTLIGTTEVRQTLNDPVEISPEEQDYLIKCYNHYFRQPINNTDITRSFAGLRPLLRSHSDPNKASREYAIEKKGQLISVFGGKWTTSHALALAVAKTL